jgi:hypothetical protein
LPDIDDFEQVGVQLHGSGNRVTDIHIAPFVFCCISVRFFAIVCFGKGGFWLFMDIVDVCNILKVSGLYAEMADDCGGLSGIL